MKHFLPALLALAQLSTAATIFRINRDVNGTGSFASAASATSSLFATDGSGTFSLIPKSTFSDAAHVHTWASLTSKPTTLAGYGITDAPTGSGTSTGANTGDETTATIKTKLGITTLAGSNTGDQDLSSYALTSSLASYVPVTRTINGTALSGNITISSISGNAGTVTTINGRIAAGTNVTISGSGTAASPYSISASGGGGGGGPVYYNVKTSFSPVAVGDGSTDDTLAIQAAINGVHAAGGGVLYFPAGVYVVGGSLQDTGNANAQLVIPATSVTAPQVAIKFLGPMRPPNQYHPTNGVVPPTTGFATIKSTLTGATGKASIISGTTESTASGLQCNVGLELENIIIQLPSNPTLSGVDCQYLQSAPVKGVVIHCGETDLADVVEPTHNNSYGIKLPEYNHSPGIPITELAVFGCYTGTRLGENTTGTGLRAWGCINGFESPFAYHANYIQDIGTYWCPYGIRVTGTSYLRVFSWDIERANGEGAGWQDSIADLYDLDDELHGDAHFLSVAAGVGVDHIFLKTGGSTFYATEIGTSPSALPTTANGWWNDDGAIAGVVAAFAPKGAASHTASKINLYQPGSHNLSDGVAPTFDAANGWIFNGSTHYLVSDIVPAFARTNTVIVKLASATTGGGHAFGCIDGSFLFGIQPIDDSTDGSAKVAYLHGSYARVSPSAASGVLAVRGSVMNRNGVDEGSPIASAGTQSTVPVYIGAIQSGGAATGFGAMTISSIAFYSAQLTQAEVAAVAAAMP